MDFLESNHCIGIGQGSQLSSAYEIIDFVESVEMYSEVIQLH